MTYHASVMAESDLRRIKCDIFNSGKKEYLDANLYSYTNGLGLHFVIKLAQLVRHLLTVQEFASLIPCGVIFFAHVETLS